VDTTQKAGGEGRSKGHRERRGKGRRDGRGERHHEGCCREAGHEERCREAGRAEAGREEAGRAEAGRAKAGRAEAGRAEAGREEVGGENDGLEEGEIGHVAACHRMDRIPARLFCRSLAARSPPARRQRACGLRRVAILPVRIEARRGGSMSRFTPYGAGAGAQYTVAAPPPTELARTVEDVSIVAVVVVIAIILIVFFSVYLIVRFLRRVVDAPAEAAPAAGCAAWLEARRLGYLAGSPPPADPATGRPYTVCQAATQAVLDAQTLTGGACPRAAPESAASQQDPYRAYLASQHCAVAGPARA
jgi:hypothetical protein